MNVGVDADQSAALGAIWSAFCTASEKGEEDPLSVMWRAYLNGRNMAQSGEKSSSCVGEHIYIGQFSDASGLSYLNARYYNGAQGQFTSEDPVFWGQQNLGDPQSLNTYSYSEDNPIVQSDPQGKCAEDGCAVEAMAVFGFGAGVANQAFRDYQTGAFSQRSLAGNLWTYSVAGAGGAAAAAGGAYAGLSLEGASLLTRVGLGFLASGGINAANETGVDYATNQSIDGTGVAIDSTVAGVTDGVVRLAPGIPGANPQSFSSAINVLKKTHAAQWGAETLFGTGAGMLSSAGYSYASSNLGGGSRNSGGAISPSSFSGSAPITAQSLGVGNNSGSFNGTFNFGPGIGAKSFVNSVLQK